jgi:phasin family protein
MYDQINEQIQSSFKPMTDLMALNVKTIETLTATQTKFFTSALSESMAFTQNLAAQKDLAGVLQVQKEYSEGLQSKVVDASKDTYALMTETQDQAAELLKGAFTAAQAGFSEFSAEKASAKSKVAK